MKLKFDVTAKEYGILRDILTDMLPPDSRVWVFGSRAKNTVRFNSDIDLALEPAKGKPLPKDTIARLKDAFNDAPLPYRVDVLDINAVSETFQTIIRRQAIAFPLAKGNKVPKLRFPEFSGDWVEKRLGEVAHTTTGDSNREDSTDAGEFVFFDRSEDLRFSNRFIFEGEAIIVAGEGSDFPPRYFKGKFDLHQRTYAIMNFQNAIGKFIYFQMHFRKRHFLRVAVGSTVPSLRLPMFEKFPISLPIPEEQQKIAAFLSAIDTKISQITKKKALLEQYKRGVMQKLFSQELRFKDAQGKAFPDWVEKRLGEVLKIGSGRDYKHLGAGDIPVYGTGGFMTSVDEYLHDGESVCIGRKGTIDKPVYLTGKFWTVDTLFFTHSFITSVPKFIYAIFQTINWKKHNEASGVPSLSKATIEKIKITMPTPYEQQKIANFLSAIDQKIDQIATELDHAKTFKKGLLQQMFI